MTSTFTPVIPCLSTLSFKNCPMLTSMPMFPHLERELDLDNASSKPLQQTMMMNMAKTLPLQNLTSLESLNIFDCHRLKSLSPSIQHLIALQVSTAKPNVNNNSLHFITPLSNLKYIQLSSIADLETLPLQNLTSLESLNIFDCHRLKSLSPSIQHLIALQVSTAKPNVNNSSLHFIHSSLKIEVYTTEFHCGSRNSAATKLTSLESLNILMP
ncbi:hypothetical protein SLA2020_273770 [Shorea laevis]